MDHDPQFPVLEQIAGQARHYYDELRDQGFSDSQAFELTCIWHRNCVTSPLNADAVKRMADAVDRLGAEFSEARK